MTDIDRARELDDDYHINKEATYSQEEYSELEEKIEDLQHENEELKDIVVSIRSFVDNHFKNVDKLYYKYDRKYLISEIREDIKNIIGEEND